MFTYKYSIVKFSKESQCFYKILCRLYVFGYWTPFCWYTVFNEYDNIYQFYDYQFKDGLKLYNWLVEQERLRQIPFSAKIVDVEKIGDNNDK